jgi:apolipoprotein N-acyltransferase
MKPPTADEGLTTRPSLVWVVVGGLATAVAFPLQPDPTRPAVALWPLAWVGLAPFLARLLGSTSALDAARTAFAFAAPWFLLDCVWVFRVFDAFGWVLVWLPVLWVVSFAVAAHAVRRAGFSPWWSWPLLWVAVEFLRSEWSPIRLDWFSETLDPLRFSWLVLGHSRVSEPFLAQTADLWGGYGLSLAPFLTNLLLATLWGGRRVRLRPAVGVAALIAAEIGYGAWGLRQEPAGPMVAVGVVQSERESLPALAEWTDELLRECPDVRVVVWPEEGFSEQSGDLDTMRSVARRHGVVLVAGAEHAVPGRPHENRAYWVPPDGEVGIYHKRERVPFVERHIRSDDVPTFQLAVGGREVRCGIAICYDMDFPTSARRLARAGAELILMPALDEGGWGGTQHAQHAILPRLRAIENRRPVAQAGTSGVSQLIDDRGRVLAAVPYGLNRRPARGTLYHEGVACAAVYPHGGTTPYAPGGHWLGPVASVGAGVVVLVAAFRRSRPARD